MRAHLAGAINFAGNFVKRNALAVDSDGQDRTFIEFRVRDRLLNSDILSSSCLLQPGSRMCSARDQVELVKHQR